ncbi:hypothetical protein N7490_012297 [Penicillium lividum]|nr:hypothetical protein N7490_012297 [Penicillium lividum]
MPVPASAWPTLVSGTGRTAPADTTARLLNATHDTKQLLSYIDKQNGHRVPTQVLQHLKLLEELTGDLLKNPLGADWRAEFSQLRQETLEMRKDLTAVRAAAERHLPTRMSTGSWAEVVRGAPGPAHHLSSHGSASSGAAAVSDIAADRAITVRLNDPDAVNRYRRETPVEMTAKANRLRERAAKAVGSGDLRFTARSAKEAEILRVHREGWVHSLGRKAEVLLPTWGIVIHDINVRSLGVNTPRTEELRGVQDKVINQLLANNGPDWGEGAELTRLSWLRTPAGKTGSLVVEFTSPLPANAAIDRGVFWDGSCLTAVMYDRAIRVRQCHNCQKYGHIGATCPNQSPTCVHCAGGHLSQKCSAKADGTLKENKCANCGGTHAAWANDCPDRVREVDKMKEMARYRPRYHPVPAHFSAKASSVVLQPSPASSWGTPAGQSSSSEGSGTEGSDSTPAESAAQGSISLQSSQWAKTQKRGTSTQSGATVSKSSLQRQQPAANELSVSMDTARL